MDSKIYINYFNYGYMREKHNSIALKKLIEAIPENSAILAPIKAGRDQYKQEKIKARIRGISNGRKKKETSI